MQLTFYRGRKMPRLKEQAGAGRASEPDFSSRLKEAKDQLDQLRGQQELIEREKTQLEELKILTEELENEKKTVSGRLASAISELEKKEHEMRIAQQEAISARNELENAADEIQIAEKKSLKIDDVKEKISFEKQAVDNAKASLEKTSGRLEFIRREEYDFEDEEEEAESAGGLWDMAGFAEGFKHGVGFFAAGLAAAVIFYILYMLTGGQ